MTDSLQRFTLDGSRVRGEFVSLDASWLEVVRRHDLPNSVRDRLGELSAAALLLAASLKFDGALVLQIHGDGPVQLLVVECDASGAFRATVKMREGAQAADDAPLGELVNANDAGRFVVTLAPRERASNRQTYQGVVAFEGETVAEVLEHYMARSEQVPTRLWLAADRRRSVGLLLQRLPDDGGRAAAPSAADDDDWQRMQHLAQTITRDELLELPPEQVLRRLFWQERLRAIDRRPCRFECSCSREKVASMLAMLGPAEVEGIVAERGSVEVRCEFCNQAYAFDPIDCAALFVANTNPAGPTKLQ